MNNPQESMNEWQTCYELVWNNKDEVVIYQTIHHPYLHEGKPWGMEVEVAHNKTKNAWVKITPGSGSHHELITEAEAKELMAGGTKLIWTRKA